MKTIGIIAEYNPFHQGHRYLIEEALKRTGGDCIVSVMSGSFTQRGMPAVYDKWKRAEMALEEGVNLVLELPAVYSCNSAEYFAKGGIDILEGTGGIDYLAFGSESGDIENLVNCAAILKDREGEITAHIKEKTKEGMSYPKAREAAFEHLGYSQYLPYIKDPNNILAIEYLKWIDKMKPVTVKRQGEGHHHSASEIRKEIRKKEPGVLEIPEDNYYRLVATRILQMNDSELDSIFSSGAGLGAKLKKEIRYSENTEEFIDRVKSKAYTRTRINRLLTHTLLGIDKDAMEKAVPYARVLGFDRKGSAFLKQIRKDESNKIPVITNINKEAHLYPEIEETLNKDILATDIYNLLTERNLYEYSDYVKRPIVLKR